MSDHRSSRDPNWPFLVIAALAIAALAISPVIAVWLAIGAVAWFAAGTFTQSRRAKNLSLLRNYWWIGLIWAAIIALIAINELTKDY